MLSDDVLIGWLRDAAPCCQWTASVCTGAGLYAAAGLLEGKKTTTHPLQMAARVNRQAATARFRRALVERRQ